jgi:hypothetical protein
MTFRSAAAFLFGPRFGIWAGRGGVRLLREFCLTGASVVERCGCSKGLGGAGGWWSQKLGDAGGRSSNGLGDARI